MRMMHPPSVESTVTRPEHLQQDETLPVMPASELEPGGEAGFGAMRGGEGLLPLSAMDVRARIVGLVAQIEVEQTFVNASQAPIEATYIFPLPPYAAVTDFSMEVAGRVVRGALKRKEEARQTYERALDEGKRAALAEEERPGVFTMQVGNIMPGESARVRLSMTGPVLCRDGEATFRFPLVVAPRYIPGQALPGPSAGLGVQADTDAVPDASRISPPVLLPGFPNRVRLSVSVDIEGGGVPVRGLRSSLHAVRRRVEGDRSRVSLLPGDRLDRDFVLRYEVSSAMLATALTLCPDEDGDEGTFLLSVVPPGAREAERPRDVIFVLDRSGSMEGWKMVAARRAVSRMVQTLGARDRFSIYAFDHSVETPPCADGRALMPATEANRAAAEDYLSRVEARGGTEMVDPLRDAAERLSGGYHDRLKRVVLVTDGQVGNEDHILSELRRRIKNVRIFTVGIDRAVNAGFLQRLAQMGGGECELVESEPRLDEVMARIHRAIGTPVLTEIGLEFEGATPIGGSVVPKRLPDLFSGVPALISGRYKGARGRVEALMTGVEADGGTVRQRVEAVERRFKAITTLWARAQVRALEDSLGAGHGDRFGLEQRVVETSLNFGVLSSMTAFVAVDEAERINPGGPRVKAIQPVQAPSGWQSGAMRTQCGSISGALAHEMPCAMSMAPPSPAPMAESARTMVGRGKVRPIFVGSMLEEAEPEPEMLPRRASKTSIGLLLLAVALMLLLAVALGWLMWVLW